MKIRTDFVTNSSSSSFSVIVMVEDKEGEVFSFRDDPRSYSSDDCGEAQFTGSLKNTSVKINEEELKTALSRDYRLIIDSEKAEKRWEEELHVGARVDVREKRFDSENGRQPLVLEIYRNDILVGEIHLNDGITSGVLAFRRALDGREYDFSGVVTRIEKKCKHNKTDIFINIRIIANKNDSGRGMEDKLMIFDSVKELCNFLTQSVKDDSGWWLDGGVDYKQNNRLKKAKDKFTADVTGKVKEISDIKTISISREYMAWGEFADLIADNDEKLCGYAKRVMDAHGEERNRIMKEMLEYIHTPSSSRQGENFGWGYEINYIWDDDETALLKLCKRLTNHRGPDVVSGVECQELDVETGEYRSYANFNLQ